MVYNQETAERVRKTLACRRGIEEKKMFGGIGFLLNGNMCVGVWKEFLILRIGEADYETALAERFAKEFDITGRSMKGWIMVEPDGFIDDAYLSEWVKQALGFVKTLPAK